MENQNEECASGSIDHEIWGHGDVLDVINIAESANLSSLTH